MEFELDAEPDDLTVLAGLKSLAALRDGRPRAQSVRVVWHDSPDHILLNQGLTLAERRGEWRVERVVPSSATWLPGQPPAVVEQAEERASLTAALPAPLAPVAAFVGRRSISVYRFPLTPDTTVPTTASPPASAIQPAAAQATSAQVTLTTERGVLRSVTAERPITRILLSGDELAVRSAALMIAAAAPVSVPRASLAARAIAMAAGGTPEPRHLGAPVLPDADISVSDALAHILGHLTDVILHCAPTATLSVGEASGRRRPQAHDVPAGDTPVAHTSEKAQMEAVHQMRVAVRRALSAVSIFRDVLPEGSLDPVHGGLKALGARLAQTRDWDVFVAETAPLITEALPPDERLERLIAAARRRRRECRKELSEYLTSSAFRALTIELAWFSAAAFWRSRDTPSVDVPSRDGPDDPPAAASDERPAGPLPVRDFAPRVLQQRWKKLVSSGKRMPELDVPALHGVRLRAKRARYAAEMFAMLHEGKAAHRFIRRLSVLQQRLGVLNDGAVATQLLQELGGPSGRHAYAVGVAVGFIAARAGRIRPRIIRAFERFRRQPAYWT
jgi:triphosphatase